MFKTFCLDWNGCFAQPETEHFAWRPFFFFLKKKETYIHKSKEVETDQARGDLRQLPSDLFSTWSEKFKTSSKCGLQRKWWRSVHFGKWPRHQVKVFLLAFFQRILLFESWGAESCTQEEPAVGCEGVLWEQENADTEPSSSWDGEASQRERV